MYMYLQGRHMQCSNSYLSAQVMTKPAMPPGFYSVFLINKLLFCWNSISSEAVSCSSLFIHILHVYLFSAITCCAL